MIGGLLAIVAGIVALVGLTGRMTTPRTWMQTLLAALPVLAVSGIFTAAHGWNLVAVIVMALAVVLGMLGSLIGPAVLSVGDGHQVARTWQLLSWIVTGVVLAAGVIRWGASLAAPIPLLNPSFLAVVLTVAAVAAAAGAGAFRGIVSTATVIMLILFVLLVVVGVVGGRPGTLTQPLVDVGQSTGMWLQFLVVIVVGAANPALRRIRADGGSIVPGTVIMGLISLISLVLLLSFNGGYLRLPSFGFGTVAGYAGKSAVPGAILCPLLILVVLGAAVVTLRGVLDSIGEFAPVPGSRWWSSRWAVAAAVGLVTAVLSAYWLPLERALALAAVFVVSGWIVAWRSSGDDDAEGTAERIDPVAAGRGPSSDPAVQ